jgi:hypothetical protein
MISADDDDTDQLYFRQRSEWHAHRAAVADDGSTRTLHERFAALYAQRAVSPSST